MLTINHFHRVVAAKNVFVINILRWKGDNFDKSEI